MTYYVVGLHHPHIDDSIIVELYSDKTDPRTSIVGRVGELKRLGYWTVNERWNFARGTRKQAIENGGVPQWKPVVEEEESPEAQPVKRPHIDDSDPNNPIFRTVVGKQEFSFSIRYVPKEHQAKLATIVANSLSEAHIDGQKEARAEIRSAIRNALMLEGSYAAKTRSV